MEGAGTPGPPVPGGGGVAVRGTRVEGMGVGPASTEGRMEPGAAVEREGKGGVATVGVAVLVATEGEGVGTWPAARVAALKALLGTVRVA